MKGKASALERVISQLDDIAVQIRALEAEAEIFLHEQNNPEAAADNMRQKAKLLAEMPQTIDSDLKEIAGAMKEIISDAVTSYSRRGQAALKQDSVFWMRNLLYPEDYVQGAPNDLEEFIAELAE